ncbi:hypothetical protein K9N68_02965 [Kovacikia minuta CCNUW1]|uniref:hypothetical protein n=1 Tax=Kovacikia minuta TaxID=2931930 RepID=UPI001CCB7982|nr:hypothetical protein [Kovacikia minuta]UBF26962.1 hypothetical protein K9N68_02965 [Kovacikia minuta CCNUW1]
MPETIQDGDEVEVAITLVSKKKLPFPTFHLGVKDEYLNREKIYEPDSDIL